MFVMSAISFYTSRVVLQTLGVSDYGVYNVMGGVIGMLGYVNSLLTGGTARFLTIGLGEGDMAKLKNTFSTTITLTVVSAAIVLILGETIGLWFMNTELNIPHERMGAANWVYQCALLSTCLAIMQSPFTASIVSHERMSVYAYMSMLDGVLKLLIVYFLIVFDYDKLKLYAVLMLATHVIDIVLYRIYCYRNFEECSVGLSFDPQLFRRMFSYSGWNMVGAFAGILANYGVNIITNTFFGTLVNAARGVTTQVLGIVNQFYSNFQMASNPQITKYYAQNKYEELANLAINTSKYSAYLLLCIIIPLGVNIEGLLRLWLHEVPEYTTIFIRCSMIYSLVIATKSPLGTAIHATGRMKAPNLSTALINMCVFPLSYLAFKMGAHPAWAYIIHSTTSFICMGVDLFITKRYINFPVWKFLSKSVVWVVIMTFACLIIPVTALYFIGNETFLATFASGFIAAVSTSAIIFFIGIPKAMQNQVLIKLKLKRNE